MPKRKRKTNSKKQIQKYELPQGFWQQALAVILIAFSLLLVVTWFKAGGPVLKKINDEIFRIVGYSIYFLPLFLIYWSVEVFRSDSSHVPLVEKIALILEYIWLIGLVGLIIPSSHDMVAGGIIGQNIDSGLLALVNRGVAILIYAILLLLTGLFIFRVSPSAFFGKIKNSLSIEQIKEIENKKGLNKNGLNTSNINNVSTSIPTSSELVDDNFELKANVPIQTSKPQVLAKAEAKAGADKPKEQISALITTSDPNWKSPSLDLLEKKQTPADAGDVKMNARIIHDTLAEFGIAVKMEGANIGPKVTQYTLKPPSGVKLSKIIQLENNIALNLAAPSLRIEAPIPGQKAVGIEVPNRRAADVRLYDILNSKRWEQAKEPLSFAIGKDVSGEAVIGELNKMPHLLIAGQTGSGKSVMINTVLCSLLYRNSPSDMKLILVDPKQVELVPYNGIPHLLTPIITEPDKTISAFKWAVTEMDRRYRLLADEGFRDIKSYNNWVRTQGSHKIKVQDESAEPAISEGAMPYIVIIVDELSDLMMTAPRDMEAYIVRIAQKARAVGIHLVLATQRPSVNVITGLIKANIPARVAFTVASQVDSRTILDQVGAEKLLGQGDMLFKTASMPKPKRIQGAWVMDEEVTKITNYLKEQSEPQYNEEVISQTVQLNNKGGNLVADFSSDSSNDDELFKDAVRVVIESKKASTSLLQRRLRVGYARAARIIEDMEDQGIVGPQNGSKPRDVLINSVDELSDNND